MWLIDVCGGWEAIVGLGVRVSVGITGREVKKKRKKFVIKNKTCYLFSNLPNCPNSESSAGNNDPSM